MKNLAMWVVIGSAIWSVWPLVANPSRIADWGSDGWFINWAINSAGKNVWDCFGHPGSRCGTIFDGNIYYPYKNVMAYSDMFFLSGFWTRLGEVLSNKPGLVSGWVMIFGQVGTMVIAYVWFKKISENQWSAAIAAVALGLSQIRWEYRAHMHTWSMQYWLLGSYLICAGLESKKLWKVYLGGILVGLQAWESVLPVYMAIVLITSFVIFNLKFDFFNKLSKTKLLKHIVLAGILSGIIMLPVFMVYSGVAREFNFKRDIREAAHNGISVDDLWQNKFGSTGLVILLLMALIVSKDSRNSRWLLVLLAFGVVMALGPTLKWQGKTVKLAGLPIPLPYAVAYYTIPGFKGLRTPSRWLWVSAFAAAGLIAIGVRNKKNLGIAAALVVAIAGGVGEVKYIDLPGQEKIPEVYKWIGSQPGKVVLELPRGGDERESKRMYYSLMTEKSLVNGFSGFSPPEVKVAADYVIMHGKDDEEKAVVYMRSGSSYRAVWSSGLESAAGPF